MGSIGWWWGIQSHPLFFVEEEYWLCVSFAMPGKCLFTVRYAIPTEPVTFPPPLAAMSHRITPLDKQILKATLAFTTKSTSPLMMRYSSCDGEEKEEDEKDDDDDEMDVMDMTKRFKMMVGPDGDAFGKGNVDLHLITAESLYDMADKTLLATTMIKLMLTGRTPEMVVHMADGERRIANGKTWLCVGESSNSSHPKSVT
jgi:hypothetical protein